MFSSLAHYARLKLEGWSVARSGDIFSFPHRLGGYRLLKGKRDGIEIGAFNCPAVLPAGCRVRYCDLHTKEQAIELFPEVKPSRLVSVDHVINLDISGLRDIADASHDFVIANHVLEHVANPLCVLFEILRVSKPDGVLVLSLPDKDYTFDKPRAVTPFEHLIEDFRNGVKEVCDDHYVDFVKAVYPDHFAKGENVWRPLFESAKARHEHAHVWNSPAARDFFARAMKEIFQVSAHPVYESFGEDNRYEYFSVWKRSPPQ